MEATCGQYFALRQLRATEACEVSSDKLGGYGGHVRAVLCAAPAPGDRSMRGVERQVGRIWRPRAGSTLRCASSGRQKHARCRATSWEDMEATCGQYFALRQLRATEACEVSSDKLGGVIRQGAIVDVVEVLSCRRTRSRASVPCCVAALTRQS